MNLRLFSKFVIAVGAFILFCGFVYYVDNIPEQLDSKKYRGVDNWSKYFRKEAENARRMRNLGDAAVVLMIGGAITVVGVGLFVSSRKSENATTVNNTSAVSKALFCAQCGHALSKEGHCPQCQSSSSTA